MGPDMERMFRDEQSMHSEQWGRRPERHGDLSNGLETDRENSPLWFMVKLNIERRRSTETGCSLEHANEVSCASAKVLQCGV